MRTEFFRRARIFPAAVLLALASGGALSAQFPAREGSSDAASTPRGSSGHGERSAIAELPASVDPAVREREKRLFGRVICDCPPENWTRTLANCREACADPQKNAIRKQIRDGWSDAEIFAAEVARVGPLVLANPGWGGTGKWLFILPVLAFIGGAFVAGGAIRRSQAAGVAARRARRERHGEIASEEVARIERDLEKIE